MRWGSPVPSGKFEEVQNHGKNLSTQEKTEKQGPWLQKKNDDRQRTESFGKKKSQRKKKIISLIIKVT